MNEKNILPNGVFPVMLTPFKNNEVDYLSLAKLVEWYIESGAAGLFAACQSSEINYLSDQEMHDIVKFIVKHVDGRVPVVASGHTADKPAQQIRQLQSMVEAGADGVVLITNRLGDQNFTDQAVIHRMEEIMSELPENIPMGLYECPSPWKRLLNRDILKWCVDSGRFTFLKDTCCDTEMLNDRLALTQNSNFKIYNANGPTLLSSLKAGAAGYSGVMANYHCDLYVWLCSHFAQQTLLVEEMARFLSATSLYEFVNYPTSAKYIQKLLGTFDSTFSRSIDEAQFYTSANLLLLEHLQALADSYRQKIVKL
ncbi:dihydrodipicolinate synthase family protein [Vibrio salinus]|uniref:dihydrodipicolinate synthase family protein n=1 Tax=Vibrio salinus TaxID=2899784 RepID=UPI001E2D1899|nr:dihydrodipicolinate synthase family protein [Vibrio salinus]MCE0495633.1 dihydrodipicolinate synthase family protein [Vibrio salinus]